MSYETNIPSHNDNEAAKGFTFIPFVKGVSKQIKQTLSSFDVRTTGAFTLIWVVKMTRQNTDTETAFLYYHDQRQSHT